MRSEPFRREIEELVLGQQIRLKFVVLRRLVLFVGRDATAAVHGSAAIGALDVLHIFGLCAFAVVIIQERYVGVVALDQTAAGRIVMSCGERQSGVVIQRINGLDQTLSK